MLRSSIGWSSSSSTVSGASKLVASARERSFPDSAVVGVTVVKEGTETGLLGGGERCCGVVDGAIRFGSGSVDGVRVEAVAGGRGLLSDLALVLLLLARGE